MINRRYAKMAAAVLIAAVFGAGCSSVEIHEAAGDKGSVTYKTDGGKEVTLSSEAKLPEGFPSDIPLPAAIAVTASISSKESGNKMVSIETKMPFAEVVKLYKDYADKAGYKENFVMQEEGVYSYSGSKAGELFVFNLALDQEDKKTVTGALTHEKKP
ncbi:hypothetical protein SAMN02799630_04236 [Paenibacillus sp. UNCCL117]|uniref:hypothetical protein n=1 Tax=unclassified Paenibacillus TaxID=185978 RepID=UPI000891DC8E|nr:MULTISPECIES: hypothetical protein [unclassified Paenibacillus]SDD82776.1 hypothetical protein SAMN04488602_11416 [Paenibacillus sp. cl123]SFW55051.1 hypothetical protein SAMN02799630_04236 [Paenibacillus sp. UNCCL117]